MPQSVSIIIHIAFSALTGVRRVPLFRAGRGCYDLGVYMLVGGFFRFQFWNLFTAFQDLSTDLTFLPSCNSRTLCRCRHFRYVCCFVPQRVSVIIYIAFSALTGVRRVPLFRTGRECYDLGVCMLVGRSLVRRFNRIVIIIDL